MAARRQKPRQFCRFHGRFHRTYNDSPGPRTIYLSRTTIRRKVVSREPAHTKHPELNTFEVWAHLLAKALWS